MQFPPIAPNDVQATLLELTARSICDAIEKTSENQAPVFLCGGGSANLALRRRIKELLTQRSVSDTQQLGIPPDWVEAVAFAWLAKQTLSHLPGNIPAVTGAKGCTYSWRDLSSVITNTLAQIAKRGKRRKWQDASEGLADARPTKIKQRRKIRSHK